MHSPPPCLVHHHTLSGTTVIMQLVRAQEPLTPTALLVLGIDSSFRKAFIRLVRWRIFDWFMLLTILANCVTLAMASNKPGFDESRMGMSLKLSNFVFVALFALEAICKIIAQGFLFAEHTYLRSGE